MTGPIAKNDDERAVNDVKGLIQLQEDVVRLKDDLAGAKSILKQIRARYNKAKTAVLDRTELIRRQRQSVGTMFQAAPVAHAHGDPVTTAESSDGEDRQGL